jgi:hypothetical protein
VEALSMAAKAATPAHPIPRVRDAKAGHAAFDVEVPSAVDLRRKPRSVAAAQRVRGWGGLTPAMAAHVRGCRLGVLDDGGGAGALGLQPAQ